MELSWIYSKSPGLGSAFLRELPPNERIYVDTSTTDSDHWYLKKGFSKIFHRTSWPKTCLRKLYEFNFYKYASTPDHLVFKES